MHIVKNQRGIAHLGLGLVLLLVLGGIGGAGYYVFNKNKPETVSNQNTNTSDKTITQEVFLSEVEKALENKNFDRLKSFKNIDQNEDYSGLMIFNEDDYITTINRSVLLMNFSGINPCQDDNESTEECTNYKKIAKNLPEMEEVYRIIESIATKYSLKNDSVNTRSKLPEEKSQKYASTTLNYAGYKGNNFICILSEPKLEFGGPDQKPEAGEYILTFGCVDSKEYEQQHELQKKLIDASIEEFANNEDGDIDQEGLIVQITKQQGDFIAGSMGGLEGGGGYSLWKKQSGKYRYVAGGHEAPSCEQVDGLGIPKGFVPEDVCFEGNAERKIKD